MASQLEAASGSRILVADDDRLVLSTLCAGLMRAGYRVQAVDNGADALRACETDPPDLVVLDHNMPGLTGLDAARRIRARADIPILILTAYDDPSLIQEAAALGINGYFVKPTDSNQLLPSIELNLLRVQAARQHRCPGGGEPAAVRAGGRDPVTGLLNHEALETQLSELVARCAASGTTCACLSLNLDRFRAVVSELGLDASNRLLQQVVRLVQSQLRQADVFARVGEDQFFILLPCMNAESAAAAARRLLAALESESFPVDARSVRLSACVGLSLFDGSGNAEQALTRSFAALQQAKAAGPGSLSTTGVGQIGASAAEMRHENLIRRALEHDRIELDFQPILDIQRGIVGHYEALLRLRDESGTPWSPPEFLPAAERSGLIQALDYRVLELAVTHLAAMDGAGCEIGIAVNLSGRHFDGPALLGKIRGIVEESGIDPRRMIFEVTETAAVHDLKQAGCFIAELKALGCQFALDDFGVGYASLYYLKELPVDYIKIDGAFVRDLARTTADHLFVKAMVDVARGLGVKTVAEYVSDAQTLELLRDYGVDYAQGFHIGRPGPLSVPIAAARRGTGTGLGRRGR